MSEANAKSVANVAEWVVRAMALILFPMIGYLFITLANRLDRQEIVAAANGARISVVESEFSAIQARLVRIEDKLDRR